jgi:hypothetical protein
MPLRDRGTRRGGTALANGGRMLGALAIKASVDLGSSLRPRLPLRHFTLDCSARSFGDPGDDVLAEAFVAEIFRAQRVRVGRCDGLGAAVTVVTASKAPRTDRRVHALVLDGVITRGLGEPRLWPIAEAPGDHELKAIARRVHARMLAWTGPSGGSRLGRRRGRVPRVQQTLVEGPPLSGLAGNGAAGMDPAHAGPRLRVRLARPLSDGTTHAVLSTRALLHRLRSVLGAEAAPGGRAVGRAESLGAPIRAHGLLWPVPADDLPPHVGADLVDALPISKGQVSRRPDLACVRPLRDVAP